MRGVRWDSVKEGYKKCLTKLQRMKDVLVSAFTFDDKPNPYVKEKTPAQALKQTNNIPFTGKGTNYQRAVEYISFLMTKGLSQGRLEYLSCIMFLSDGVCEGAYPDEGLRRLLASKNEGRKMLFYTIACATHEDEDMKRMVSTMGGEHYNVSNPEATRQVFAIILGV